MLPFLLLLSFVYAQPSFAALSEEQRKQWSIINHYNEEGVSDIINEEYFLAPDGRTNPDAEYRAFITILKTYKQKGEGVETLCRFPARMTFAQKMLDWFSEIDRPECKEYLEQTNADNVESISLVFASGYFDNPSSYYGHTLLRFNYDRNVLDQKTLNSSLNYGANFSDQDGTFTYVLNGLFGGYEASYQRNNNFIHSHMYTNAQLRDLWEYKLNLTPEQVRFVVEHSWELMRARFTYYFFNDNCAHRIIDLVERATSSRLAYSHGFWALPIQVVEHAAEHQTALGPLLASEEYYPSLKSTFSKRYDELSGVEQDQFLHFFKSSDQERKKIVKDMDEKILLLVLEQLDIQMAKLTIQEDRSDEDKKLQERRRIVLNEFFHRPSGYRPDQLFWGDDYTLLKYKPVSVVRAGVLRRGDTNYASITYQIANNDEIDTPIAGQERSKVVMGSLQVDVSEDNVQLRDLTLVDVMNLNTNPLPMWLTSEYSWRLRAAYDHRNQTCKSCGSFGVTGTVGKSLRFTKDLMSYVLVGGTLRHKEVDGFGYAAGVSEGGVIYSPVSNHVLKLGFDALYDPLKKEDDLAVNAQYSYKISKQNDIRLEYENDIDGEDSISLKFGYYFN